jgi:hypothetical protein
MIYLIRAGASPYYKIGHTKREADIRKSEIQGNNHLPCLVSGVWPGSVQDEKTAHRALSMWHVHREWFVFPYDEVYTWVREHGYPGPPEGDMALLLPYLITIGSKITAEHRRDLGMPLRDREVHLRIFSTLPHFYSQHADKPSPPSPDIGKGGFDLLSMGWFGGLPWTDYPLEEFTTLWAFEIKTLLPLLLDEGLVQCQNQKWRICLAHPDASLLWDVFEGESGTSF